MKFDRSACIEPMYSEIPFLDRFQAAKDDGFEYVEFWSWTDKIWMLSRQRQRRPVSVFRVSMAMRIIRSSTRPTRKNIWNFSSSRSQRHARSAPRALPFTRMHSVTAALWSTTTPTCPTR